MQTAAFRAHGLDAEYALRPTPPEALPELVMDLRSGRLAGANVTVPHKIVLRECLDQESATVEALGAVNTILGGSAGLRGHNTDLAGFEQALAALGMSAGAGRAALVLGAGGAARAVAYGLLRAGYRVTILGRRMARAATTVGALYRALPGAPLSTAPLDPGRLMVLAREAALLVNATPVGADGASSLWPDPEPIPSDLTVLDCVAWPLETPLVQRARGAGGTAQGGFEMLLGQAARAFTLWTGLPAPLGPMRAAGLEAATAAGADPSVLRALSEALPA